MALPCFDAVRILVAGDVMLDSYWHGDASRISPEAPVPVVHVRGVERRPGGAGNVAVNVAALGCACALLGVTGRDEAAGALATLLDEHGVEHDLIGVAGVATVTKMRVLSRHQQLIRLDIEDGFTSSASAELLDRFQRALGAADAVILSDYGKGTLAAPGPLIEAARGAGKPVLIDPKGTDFSRYRGATAITPNLTEFEAVAGRARDLDDLAARAESVRASIGVDAVLVTRGGEGMSLVSAARAPVHVPAQAREVYDVTGAGDTVIATFAAALAAGEDLAGAMHWANVAAGVVVGKLGAATVTPAELVRVAQRDRLEHRGVIEEADLVAAVQAARAAGDRVVMTNGCFDLLHAGHASYLARARALGDRLVVAVNDDDSVKRLKGHGRPIVALDQRMMLLAALEAVDWVVPFAEDTPERLVRAVSPDVLVKGGDYAPGAIAGGEWVRANGGRVEIVEFIEGCSTSSIIRAAGALRGEGGGR